MAKHLTWCLKRTFILTSRLNVNLQPRLVAKASNTVSLKRHSEIAGYRKSDVDIVNLRELDMFTEDAKCGTKVAVACLRKILCISESNATEAVDDCPRFKFVSKKTIYENFQILRESGMFKSTVKDNKFLLATSTDDLQSMISYIKRLDLDINDGVALFHLQCKTLKKISDYIKIDVSYLPSRNKLWYLAEKLECDLEKICQVISYNPWLMMMPPPKLMTITEYVLAAGMKPEHILSDLVLYKYPLASIKVKVEEAKRLGIEPMKPWIMRCSARNWAVARERFEQRQGVSKPKLSYSSREELLCDIFGCSVEMARSIVKRSPKILIMSIDKLYTNAQLIRSEGYEAEDIMTAFDTIQRNTDTLKERFAKWRAAGLSKPRLFVYTLSEKNFQIVMSRKLKAMKMAQ